VRVGHGAAPQVLRPVVGAGPLGEADEEALLGGEAVAPLLGLARARRAPGLVGQDGAAEVRDILAKDPYTPAGVYEISTLAEWQPLFPFS